MATITVPTLPDLSGPDLSGLGGTEPLAYTRDPGGATYTVTMPPDWRDPALVETACLLAVCDLEGIAVEEAIEALPEPDRTVARRRMAAPYIRRDHPLVLALQAALQLSDEAVDGLWARAAEIAA